VIPGIRRSAARGAQRRPGDPTPEITLCKAVSIVPGASGRPAVTGSVSCGQKVGSLQLKGTRR